MESAWGEVEVTDSVSVLLFVYIPGMICMMCCTWYVSVVALKVKEASYTQSRGGLQTKQIYVFECSQSTTKIWKPHLVMSGTWCRVYFLHVTWYLVHNTSMNALVRAIFCTSAWYLVASTWCIICCCFAAAAGVYSRRTAQQQHSYCCNGCIYHHTHCRPIRYIIRRVNKCVPINYSWWFPLQNFLTLTALAWSSLSTDSLDSAAFPSRG